MAITVATRRRPVGFFPPEVGKDALVAHASRGRKDLVLFQEEQLYPECLAYADLGGAQGLQMPIWVNGFCWTRPGNDLNSFCELEHGHLQLIFPLNIGDYP